MCSRFLLAASLALALAQSQPRRLIFGRPVELIPRIELDAVAEVAIGPNGSAFILDLTNTQVFAIDSAGEVMWRVGRRGDGPGEYRLPYRIATRPQGGVAVLDWSNGRMTVLSPTGKTERTMQLPMTFTQILFTPNRPFEIQRYSLDGRLIERKAIAARLQYELTDLIAVEHRGGQIFKGTTARSKDVELPIPFVELPTGEFLGGRSTFDRTAVDLVSSTGAVEATVTRPAGCVQILGIDVRRGQLYCKALRDDAPVLYRVQWKVQR